MRLEIRKIYIKQINTAEARTNLDTEIFIDRMFSRCLDRIIAIGVDGCNYIVVINILIQECFSKDAFWKLLGIYSFKSVT